MKKLFGLFLAFAFLFAPLAGLAGAQDATGSGTDVATEGTVATDTAATTAIDATGTIATTDTDTTVSEDAAPAQ
jgi:hypothetical protein